MTEHLPECPILKPCCDDVEFPEHGFCGNFVGRCLHCRAECICDALRACEQRIREDERSSNFTPDDHADGMTEAFRLGLAAARESVESQWTEDPSWDGTNWNNALASALASIDAPREN